MVHHVGRQLHVAVLQELAAEGTQCVHLGSLGSGHLELVVDEHVHVFGHAFLLDGTLYVAVLEIGIFKLAAGDGFAVDSHYHGVSGLCCGRQGEGRQTGTKEMSHGF